jgi:hypothetical protein
MAEQPVQSKPCPICGTPVVNQQAHFEQEHQVNPPEPKPAG